MGGHGSAPFPLLYRLVQQRSQLGKQPAMVQLHLFILQSTFSTTMYTFVKKNVCTPGSQ
jgi:hypothetical protein